MTYLIDTHALIWYIAGGNEERSKEVIRFQNGVVKIKRITQK